MIRFALLTLLIGCADKIDHETSSPDAGLGSNGGSGGGGTARVATTRGTDGTYTTTVDATADDAWVDVDFETGAEVDASASWDLRFERFHISANGGVSGSGGVQVAPVMATFAALTTAPTDGWLTDTADMNADGMPDYAMDSWYDYDVDTHILTPKAITWAVKTDGGASLKLEVVKYYDGAGTSGNFTLHWGPL